MITLIIYNNIVKEMKKKNIKNNDLAEKLGVSAPAVSRRISNLKKGHDISINKIKEYSTAIGVPLQTLLTED